MSSAQVVSSLAVLLLLALAVHADVSSSYNRYSRPVSAAQQQLSRPAAYPAAGFRPNREFNLPTNTEQHHDFASQPNRFYIPPSDSQQQQQQQQSVPQRTYLTPVDERRPNEQVDSSQHAPQRTYLSPAPTASSAARLTANREQQEDVEDFDASEIELNIGEEQRKETTKADQQQVATPALAALAYYPLAYYHNYYPTTAYYSQLQAAPLIAYTVAAPQQVTATASTAAASAQQQQKSGKLTTQRTTKQRLTASLPQRNW